METCQKRVSPRWRAMQGKAGIKRQGSKWKISHISHTKKGQVLRYPACSACIFGISSHFFFWITLRRIYPQIRAELLLNLIIVSRSYWAGACRPIPSLKNLQWRRKARKVGQKVGLSQTPPQPLLPRSSFLCIPTPQLWSAVTNMGDLDWCSETARTGKCLRHRTSNLASDNTENEELRPDL